MENNNEPVSTVSSSASKALSLLLREDPLLMEHQLTSSGSAGGDSSSDVFAYAAALLHQDSTLWMSSSGNITQRAKEALAEVDRKLLLVESLADRISREKPEDVAGPLLQLHGTTLNSSTSTRSVTLEGMMDSCDRLCRQGHVLEGVAKRVEGTLQRGYVKLQQSTKRLERVLEMSATLKMAMRLRFEAKKIKHTSNYNNTTDIHDMARAAASVAIMEQLLSNFDNHDATQPQTQQQKEEIHILQGMKPQVEAVSSLVRRVSSDLLQQLIAGQTPHILGMTLQIHASLQTLSEATWKIVLASYDRAEQAGAHLWNSTSMKKLSTENNSRVQAAETWSTAVKDASFSIWNLHRTLSHKTDPTTRQSYLQMVLSDKDHIPDKFQFSTDSNCESIFELYWKAVCQALGQRITKLLGYENGVVASQVASMYPSIRTVSLDLVSNLVDVIQVSSSNPQQTQQQSSSILGSHSTNSKRSIDSWTRAECTDSFVWTQEEEDTAEETKTIMEPKHQVKSLTCLEWKLLQEDGLKPLEDAFVSSVKQRLLKPVDCLFAEAVAVDENGVPLPVLPTLPSKYDLKQLETNALKEISSYSSSDANMIRLISKECIVEMVQQFCASASTATSQAALLLDGEGVEPTPALLHNMNIARVMSTLANSLRTIPNKLKPPEEAANACQIALRPALQHMDLTVQQTILNPLTTALKQRISNDMARIHHYGIYTSSGESHYTLEPLYEEIANQILMKLPTEYATMVGTSMISYSLYNFVSNASLVRPLQEEGRLKLTQDLANLEMTCESLLQKIHSTIPLSHVNYGKPYAELRAVRQLLFWNGLAQKHKSSDELAKLLLRQAWIKDVRPSTLFHVLLTWAPKLLSSPHHSLRQSAQHYVHHTLLTTQKENEDGETASLMTILSCCDAYQQRESVTSSDKDGDARIASILTSIGPELLRRRRQ